MKNTKNTAVKTAIAILAIMLVSSLAIFANLAINSASAQDYGDIMQYDWPVGGHDEGHTGFSSGPGPDKPDVLWSVSTGGSGMVNVFDGKAFVIQGTTVRAFDAFSGDLEYAVDAPGTSAPSTISGVHKLDDTYFLTEGVGFAEAGIGSIVVRRIATGEVVWSMKLPYDGPNPGSWHYFCGHYSESMKMYYAHGWDPEELKAFIVAYDLSNPSEESPEAWKYYSDKPTEMICSGDGKVFAGTTGATVIAINGTTGERIWQTPTLGGLVQQSAIYYNGNLYTSATNTQMTCFDGETGEMLWQDEKGPRAFSAYRGAAGHGMIFDATVELDPYGAIRAWDAETGERLWMAPAYFNIAYTTMAVADGKLYTATCDQAAGIRTGGLPMPGYEFTCFDVYTGTVMWKLRGVNCATPSIAYGNLYGLWSGRLWCVGSPSKDWAYGLHGNLENPRVAVGQSAPADISTPRWEFQTGGEVSSSPAIVDGRVYVGSEDKNWYCLDAYTGEKIWNFTVGHYIRSSAAVVGGRVFTGSDDGYFYCLDAETGEKLWQTSAGGHFPNTFCAQEFQARSCPIVIGNRVYAGSLDGKVYSLSTDGRVLNTYDTGMPIFGSPAYSDGTIYIVSNDYHLYALNAADLSFKWSSIPLNMDIVIPTWPKLSAIGTPNVANGIVYVGAGVFCGEADPAVNYTATGHSVPAAHNGGAMRMMAFNATTGESVWNQTRAGNTLLHVPVYWNGAIYGPEFFYVTSMNALNPNSGSAELGDFGGTIGTTRLPGNRTWAAWTGYQNTASVAYADDLSGPKIYIGSDIGSIYCFDARTGETLSVFSAKGNVPSSPAIWEGKLYTGGCDGVVRCFDSSPVVEMSIWAEPNKSAEMWNNETLELCGQLQSNPVKLEWVPDVENPAQGVFESVPSEFHPGVPNTEVKLSITKPDGTDESLTTTTDNKGYFNFSYSPTEVGDWGWVVYYDGEAKPGVTYAGANGEWNPVSVTSAPSGEAPPPPPSGSVPMEYVYGAVAVIVIVLVAVGAYIFLKRKK